MYEVAFRTGDDVDSNTGADLAYMKELLAMIEREDPGPAPIEQRWSAGSKSPLSPATNDGHDPSKPGLHSWIGSSCTPSRPELARGHHRGVQVLREEGGGGARGVRDQDAWAKIELPEGDEERKEARRRIIAVPWGGSVSQDSRRVDPKG